MGAWGEAPGKNQWFWFALGFGSQEKPEPIFSFQGAAAPGPRFQKMQAPSARTARYSVILGV
jgi:hypothetical protein